MLFGRNVVRVRRYPHVLEHHYRDGLTRTVNENDAIGESKRYTVRRKDCCCNAFCKLLMIITLLGESRESSMERHKESGYDYSLYKS